MKPRYKDESLKTDSLVFEARTGSQHKAGENMKLVEKDGKRRKRQLKLVNKKCTVGKISKNQSGGRNGKSPGKALR